MALLNLIAVFSALMISFAFCKICIPQVCKAGLKPACAFKDAASSKMYEVYSQDMSYQDARDLCSCKKNGALCSVNASNIAAIAAKMDKPAWVDSWNNDTYGPVCLQMIGTSITVADCCDKRIAACEYDE